MARTNNPIEIQTPGTCSIHGVELVDDKCPRCEYLSRRQAAAPEEAPTTRRRTTPEPPEETPETSTEVPRKSTRTVPDDEEYRRRTRCHWPCPCGGTVPDAPDYCESRRFSSKPKTYCTDVLCCMYCGDREDCEAYRTWQKITGAVPTSHEISVRSHMKVRKEPPRSTSRRKN